MKHLNWINVSVLAVALIAIGCFSYQNLFCDNCGTDTLSPEATAPVIQTPPVIESADPAPAVNPEPVDERQAFNAVPVKPAVTTPQKKSIEAVLANFSVKEHNFWQGERIWLNQNEDAARWKYSAVNKQGSQPGGPFIWTEISENGHNGNRNLVLNVISSRNACIGKECDSFKIWHTGMAAGEAFAGGLSDSTTYDDRKELRLELNSNQINKLRQALNADEFYIEYGEGELEVIPELKTAMLQTFDAYDEILETKAMPYDPAADDSSYARRLQDQFKQLNPEGIFSNFKMVEHQRMRGIKKFVNEREIEVSMGLPWNKKIWLEIEQDLKTGDNNLLLNVRSSFNECKKNSAACGILEFFRTGWSNPWSIYDPLGKYFRGSADQYKWIPYRDNTKFRAQHRAQIILHPMQVDVLNELLIGNRAFIKYGTGKEWEIVKSLRREMLKTVIAFQNLDAERRRSTPLRDIQVLRSHDYQMSLDNPDYMVAEEKWQTNGKPIKLVSGTQKDLPELTVWLEVRMNSDHSEADLIMHAIPDQLGCISAEYRRCRISNISISANGKYQKFGSNWHKYSETNGIKGFKTSLEEFEIRVLRDKLLKVLNGKSNLYLRNYENSAKFAKHGIEFTSQVAEEMLSVLDAYSRNSLTDIPVQNASHIRRIR